jgi:hypothetical protein
MVRLFLRERYTKKAVPMRIADKALEIFSSFQLLSRSKVIHSAAVWANPNDD